MDSEIVKGLQAQLTLERTNAAAYDALGAALDTLYWPGSAAWMKRAANEEREHAAKIADYLALRKITPVYNWIPMSNVPVDDNLLLFFDAALARETTTTAAILALYALAVSTPDPQTTVFLHWFMIEQTKSEGEILSYMAMIKRLDNNGRVAFDQYLDDVIAKA
jgi:ferritin